MFDFSETPVTLLLLLVNALVSGYALFFDHTLVDRLAFKPREILKQGEYQRLITAGFVHVSLSHLAFNMITLYFFGRYVELLIGPGRFLILYFGAELAAHGLSLFLHRRRADYAAVGASGAVSGVLFGFCLFRPFEKIYFFFIPIGIPAVVFAVVYVLLSMYAMRHAREGGMTGGIAHEAHLGGAIGGLILTVLLEPRSLELFLRQIGI
jgi:membrane associated rhomboid family serine protease